MKSPPEEVTPTLVGADGNAAKIHCVIVTYGNRRDLLYKALTACRHAGIHRVIVVDNGARWNVTDDIARDFDDFATVVALEKNRGSAPGFKAGLKAALEANAGLILLLDDDLAPTRAAVSRLTQTLEQLAARMGRDRTAAVGFRRSTMQRMIQVRRSALAATITPPILEWPGNHILNRMFTAIKGTSSAVESRFLAELAEGMVRVRVAPYGGMLLHREILDRIGLPDENFVLYWDDVEWTSRIFALGGCTVIDTLAHLMEMEISYPFRERNLSRYHSTILREGGRNDFRVYYEVRNAIYFATHGARQDIRFLRSRIIAFWLGSSALALVYGAHSRGRTVRRAISDGIHGRMGYNEDYPLD